MKHSITTLFLLFSPLLLQAQTLDGTFSSLGNEQNSDPTLTAVAGLPFDVTASGENLSYGFTETEQVKQEANELKGITLSSTEITLETGDSYTLEVSFNPANAENRTLRWSSSDPAIATVKDGIVQAVSDGKALITAVSAAGIYSAQCQVEVYTQSQPDPIEVTGVALDPTDAVLAPGETLQLKATVYPSYADNKRVFWESSDEEIAQVKNGLVTALAEGSAIIRVITDDGGFTDECRISVTGNPTGLEDIEESKRVYPTCVEDVLFINLTQPETVYLVDMTGRIHKAKEMPAGINRVYMTDYPKGVYIVRLKEEAVKIIKQ